MICHLLKSTLRATTSDWLTAHFKVLIMIRRHLLIYLSKRHLVNARIKALKWLNIDDKDIL